MSFTSKIIFVFSGVLISASCIATDEQKILQHKWDLIISKKANLMGIRVPKNSEQGFFGTEKWKSIQLIANREFLYFLVSKLYSKKATKIHDSMSGYLTEGEFAFYAIQYVCGIKFEDMYKGNNKSIIKILKNKNKYASPLLYMTKEFMKTKPTIFEIVKTYINYIKARGSSGSEGSSSGSDPNGAKLSGNK